MSNNKPPSILDPNLPQWIAEQERQQSNEPQGLLYANQQVQDWLARLQKQAQAYKEYKL